MPSAIYQLFHRAILEEKQVVCSYRDHPREVCPLVIGLDKDGAEAVLAFQFAGGSGSGLPRGGEWRCLKLASVSNVVIRDGPWREGGSHRRPNTCVADVDLDVNIHVRKRR